MPVQFLSLAERDRLSQFPAAISAEEIITYFTLTEEDIGQVEQQRRPANRLGYALQLSCVRYLGFVPADLASTPEEVIAFLADQLTIPSTILHDYGERTKTVSEHFQSVLVYLGYQRATPLDLESLQRWLIDRALEHDKPSLLFSLLCEKLQQEKIIRPGVTVLERMVATARSSAHQVSLTRLSGLLTTQRKAMLDSLLETNPSSSKTTLSWLRQPAVTNSPTAVLEVLNKFVQLKSWLVDQWDVSGLNPNRQKLLARLGSRYTNQALQRMAEERRYPILVAFLTQTLMDVSDELIDIFDACMVQIHSRSKRKLDEHRKQIAMATEAKVRLFYRVGSLILDDTIADETLRSAIFRHVPLHELEAAVADANAIMRPEGYDYFDFLEKRYSYIRQFSPALLAEVPFDSNIEDDDVLQAISLLNELNELGARKLPPHPPLSFIPRKWLPFVIQQGIAQRRAYELCLLSALRDRLRSGDIFLPISRRYANPETYLIPKQQWPALQAEVCQQLELTPDGSIDLKHRADELKSLLAEVDQELKSNEKVRVEQGNLIVSPFSAEEGTESAKALADIISKRLPQVELTELLVEVNGWTNFSQCFHHAAGQESRSKEHIKHLYASIIGQGVNMGITSMAQSANLSYRKLAWTTNWYVREETLKEAMTTLVNFQCQHPLAQLWGGGTLSSSDGQRFPVSGKVRNATALPKYFGYGRGITFYTWTSDQYAQYGTKVISSTVRDATYVLDEILDNETELNILEHTTDTAGYTDLVFALFDLLGMRFSPRIRDIGDQQLYRLVDDNALYPNLDFRLTGRINLDRIQPRWENMLRVAGSLKLGWVTASLLISKLQAYPRQNKLTQVLQEYGRLIKTIFILKYLKSESYRRRIGAQLNKGEKLHELRSFLVFGEEGKIRRKQEEAQQNQAGCLNLLTNAVIVWNTVYMQAVIDALAREGYEIKEDDLAHLSPARHEHINRYGRYRFDVDFATTLDNLRPLRKA